MNSNSEDVLSVSRVLLFNDKNAFNELVLRHQGRIRRLFMGLTGGDRLLSDDLAQDTFIRAYLNLRSFRAAAGFGTWLCRIAYNIFYDHLRRHSESGLEKAPEHAAPARGTDERIDVWRAMEALRTEERMAVTLFYMEGMPVKEVARAMGCPEGSVKSLLSRGRGHIARYLHDSGYETPESAAPGKPSEADETNGIILGRYGKVR